MLDLSQIAFFLCKKKDKIQKVIIITLITGNDAASGPLTNQFVIKKDLMNFKLLWNEIATSESEHGILWHIL